MDEMHNELPRPSQRGYPITGRCNDGRQWSWWLLGKKHRVLVTVVPVTKTCPEGLLQP